MYVGRSTLALLAVTLSGLGAAPTRAQNLLFERRDRTSSYTLPNFGYAAATVGDVDGDGFAEFAVGAWSYAPAHNGQGLGRVDLLSGRDGRVVASVAGAGIGDTLGYDVAGIEDADGDGVADFAAGSPYSDVSRNNGGSLWLYSGRTRALLFRTDGATLDGNLGLAVASIGDVDLDGRGDLLVGQPAATHLNGIKGRALIYSGATGALLRTFHGDAVFDHAGFAVAALGDLDGDGVQEVAMGAPGFVLGGNLFAGRVRVHSGATGLLRFAHDGQVQGGQLGYALANIGDVDRDGHADLAAAAPGMGSFGSPPGYVSLISGATGALLHTLHAPSNSLFFGWRVAGAGDFDGDGRGDVLVSEGNAGLHGSTRVQLYSSATGAVISSFVPERNGNALGWGIAGLGDLDGDGTHEFLLGAPAQGSLGTIYVYTAAQIVRRPHR